ncbi:MAG: hypothetical protein RMJ33_04880 [Saprospiraceae bacterium]|nr:hypothetical protein [Saprospiraceae bacterium]MDW8229154.1 hypothetical protein [Saprospiraceae bacterium]
MKIRCEHNSIRLRLRKSELAQLRVERWIETSVHFPDGPVFAWELAIREDKAEMDAHFDAGRISVFVPAQQAQEWMDTDAVGMEQFIPLHGGGSLHLLVEKDFPCKDRPDEDTTDFFSELAEDAPVKC